MALNCLYRFVVSVGAEIGIYSGKKIFFMQYEDKIVKYINEQEPGFRIEIEKLTDDPDKFINAVKKLIDDGYLVDVHFSNDYKILKKGIYA